MEKRIAALSTDPHTVSLEDRPSALFIDPATGSIFVDEGEGDGRMNGAVFSPANGPAFAVRPSPGSDWRLVLDYRGTAYEIGASADEAGLRHWAVSANAVLGQAGGRGRAQPAGLNGTGGGRQPSVPKPTGIKPA